jgi:hypothetical protein
VKDALTFWLTLGRKQSFAIGYNFSCFIEVCVCVCVCLVGWLGLGTEPIASHMQATVCDFSPLIL